MIFEETPLPGAFLIRLEKHEDERGSFARTWSLQEFEEHGLAGQIVQCSISRNHKAGTLRGMHYQDPPFSEAKLIRCTRGSIYDVLIDLRPDSASHRRCASTLQLQNTTTPNFVTAMKLAELA
jgi:dTDP-4-dehydrorhamnose 3,5-epimerase